MSARWSGMAWSAADAADAVDVGAPVLEDRVLDDPAPDCTALDSVGLAAADGDGSADGVVIWLASVDDEDAPADVLPPVGVPLTELLLQPDTNSRADAAIAVMMAEARRAGNVRMMES
jgi:hypothetical protein